MVKLSVIETEELFKSLASEVPDVDDPRLINYWKIVDDKQVYIEGWCSKCFAGTGLGEYETQGKLNYAKDLTPQILDRKVQERGLKLLEGRFVETPDKDFIYGVTIGVFSKENPLVEVRFLKDVPSFLGLNGKERGPFKKGHVYALEKEAASTYVKLGQAEYVRKEAMKPTLKELFTGATLESYLEAARVKPLLAEEMEKSAVEKWRLRSKAEGLVKEIREEREKHGL